MPRFDHQNPDGKWVHGCTDCGAMLKGYGHEPFVAWVCKCSRPKPVQGPKVTIGKKTAPATPAKKRQPTQDDMRKAMPCVYLGELTGKAHKVGCVERHLEEHYCRCPQREVVEIKSRRSASRLLIPKAVPKGRCRDLEIYKGAIVACIDCPHYRAGLLAGLPE